MSEHKDAVYFDEAPAGFAQDSVKAAYRELRLWQKGLLAAITAGATDPTRIADDFVELVNEKRRELLG